jgi:hypothetical protein
MDITLTLFKVVNVLKQYPEKACVVLIAYRIWSCHCLNLLKRFDNLKTINHGYEIKTTACYLAQSQIHTLPGYAAKFFVYRLVGK